MSNDGTDRRAVTVLGDLSPSLMGKTMSHEHIFSDNWVMTFDYDFVVDSEDLAIVEVSRYGQAGGGTICDTTARGIGRNPDALARVSQATGVNIIMGAGWYREAVYPLDFDQISTNELAAELVSELIFGVGESSIRPGFIGEIGTERGAITPRQERMFRAAARAHLVTGCPIATHTTHWGELGLEQIALLREEGVPTESMIIGHLGDRYRDEVVVEIARQGVWLSVDNLAFVSGYAPLEMRADNVARLWDLGFGDQIMLSSDICNLSQLSEYGGPGYANVLENFLPLLAERGLGDAEFNQMLIQNPARAFTYSPHHDRASLEGASLVETVATTAAKV